MVDLNLNGGQRLAVLNCLGRGCEDRVGCRRFVVMLNAQQCSRDAPYGHWASFDLERVAMGDCKSFVQYRAS